MADKLGESTWTGFTKDLIKKWKLDPKLKLDDAALIKALGTFDKTEESKPEPRLKALDELIKEIPEQVKALVKRKKELGDKAFGEAKDKLYELLGLAEGLHKAVVAKIAEAKADPAKGKNDEEEEEESPALLSSKMIPLLRELRKGEAVMPFLIALAGKQTVVLISRRPISPARGKLLKEQMDKPTGLKFVRGECQYEKNALTFVVQSPGAALAKRLRQALLDQTEMRWKVRVRGEDGVEEVDGEEDLQEQGQPGAQVPKAPPGGPASAEQLAYTQRLLKVRDRYEQALEQQHPESTKLRALMGLASEKADGQKNYAAAIQALQALEKVLDASTGAQTGGVDAAAAFKARMTALIPRMKEAMAAAGPSAQDIKLKASEAGVFARKTDFERANRLLDEVEALLERGVSPEALMPKTAAGGPQGAGASGKAVVFAQLRLVWDNSKKAVQGKLETLNQAILDEWDDSEAMTAAGNLNKVLARFNEGLGACLDDLYNAATPEDRKRHAAKAKAIAERYLAYLANDPLVAHVDDNPFEIVVDAKNALSSPLNVLQRQLNQLVA